MTETAPGYWMYETSGVLRPAIEAYLCRRVMTEPQIAAMRTYLRQWINAPGWGGPKLAQLRADIERLTTQAAIARWLKIAELEGIDPL
jgi:hypothetical protein